jgi:hypothetical protein
MLRHRQSGLESFYRVAFSLKCLKYIHVLHSLISYCCLLNRNKEMSVANFSFTRVKFQSDQDWNSRILQQQQLNPIPVNLSDIRKAYAFVSYINIVCSIVLVT